MSSASRKIGASKRMALLTRVAKVSQHAGYQVITQAIAFVTGILLVRSMEKPDYAGYAICISLTSAVALVAEGGINSVVMSRGASIRDDRSKLGVLFASAMRYRYWVGVPVVVVGAGAIALLLAQNGFEPILVALAVAICMMTLWVTVTGGTYGTIHRLEYNLSTIRRATLITGLLRFIAVALLFFLGGMSILLALLLGLATTGLMNLLLRRKLFRMVPKMPADMAEYRGIFRRSAQQTLPMSVMLVAAEQSILVFLTIFGSSERIAEVTALGRFGVVYTIATMVVVDIAAPSVARSGADMTRVLKRVFGVLALYAASSAALVGGVAMFGGFLLGALGAQYAGLEVELVVIMAGSAVMNLAHAFGALNQSRGWLQNSWVHLLLVPVWALVGLLSFDLSTSVGAAWFVATQPVPFLATQFIRLLTGARAGRRT
jgi:O-antigen/teichoic acid export membrane protein